MFISMLLVSCLLCQTSFVVAYKPLVAFGDPRGNSVWSDFGSLARYEITIHEANIPSPKWNVLGHHAQNDWENLKTTIHVFQDKTPKLDGLKAPVNFTQIWNCDGDTTWQKGSIWRPVCPTGYVFVGDVAVDGNDLKEPPKELYNKVRCVRQDLTEDCKTWGVKIWDNSNSVARKDGSVWAVEPTENGFSEFFFSGTDFNAWPKFTPKCLLKSSFEVVSY